MTFDEALAEHGMAIRDMARKMSAVDPSLYDDLLSAGQVGLWQACERYNPTCGTSLWQFAVQRVRGAMADEMRSADHLSRDHRRDVKNGTKEAPMRSALDTIEEHGGALAVGAACLATPEDAAIEAEHVAMIHRALARIPERLADVFRAHVLDGTAQADVASRLRVDPSRVSHMIREASELLCVRVDRMRSNAHKDGVALRRLAATRKTCACGCGRNIPATVLAVARKYATSRCRDRHAVRNARVAQLRMLATLRRCDCGCGRNIPPTKWATKRRFATKACLTKYKTLHRKSDPNAAAKRRAAEARERRKEI